MITVLAAVLIAAVTALATGRIWARTGQSEFSS